MNIAVEKFQFILAWAFCKHSLDAAHMRGVEGSPLPEVHWLGHGKTPRQEHTMTLLLEAMHRFAAEAGLCVAPSNPPAEIKMHRRKVPSLVPPEDIPVLR